VFPQLRGGRTVNVFHLFESSKPTNDFFCFCYSLDFNFPFFKAGLFLSLILFPHEPDDFGDLGGRPSWVFLPVLLIVMAKEGYIVSGFKFDKTILFILFFYFH
jgi:hypothetical protein